MRIFCGAIAALVLSGTVFNAHAEQFQVRVPDENHEITAALVAAHLSEITGATVTLQEEPTQESSSTDSTPAVIKAIPKQDPRKWGLSRVYISVQTGTGAFVVPHASVGLGFLDNMVRASLDSNLAVGNGYSITIAPAASLHALPVQPTVSYRYYNAWTLKAFGSHHPGDKTQEKVGGVMYGIETKPIKHLDGIRLFGQYGSLPTRSEIRTDKGSRELKERKPRVAFGFTFVF